jgi:thiamine-monophosphate kinase
LNPSQRADLTAKATLLDPDQSKKAHAVIHSCDRRHQLQFVRRLFAMIQKQLLDSGEDRLIAKYFRPLVRHPGALGLTDDAAMLTPPAGCDLILKIDGIIGGVHVFQDDPAELIARKALRVNLSDLAAKGAKPVGFLLSLALPDSISADWLAAFARGLGSDADNYACPLLGGDTDRTPGLLTVYIAAFGIVPQGTMVRRNGARPGDQILVTGSIGDAALGLRLRGDPKMAAHWGLDAPMRDYLTQRYLLPQPRNAIAEALRVYAHAAMDISDGLAGDLAKLARVSNVHAEIDVGRVPLSDAVKTALAAEPPLIDDILTGGDDYEVVCTVSPDKLDAFRATAAAAGVPVTDIGRVAEGAGVRFNWDGRQLAFEHPSFSHF